MYHNTQKKGFVSIGCAPCTRAITADEDIRAGGGKPVKKMHVATQVIMNYKYKMIVGIFEFSII
jgi:3'-phosphoadenosine 5'-phosphosulfate sulfotransferase (PAPS reductase)/FAD synthetase